MDLSGEKATFSLDENTGQFAWNYNFKSVLNYMVFSIFYATLESSVKNQHRNFLKLSFPFGFLKLVYQTFYKLFPTSFSTSYLSNYTSVNEIVLSVKM